MISLKLREETVARQAPTKTCLLPYGFDSYGCAIERKINLVTGCDTQTVAYRLRDHHLPLGANTVSHTDQYNLGCVLVSSTRTQAEVLISRQTTRTRDLYRASGECPWSLTPEDRLWRQPHHPMLVAASR